MEKFKSQEDEENSTDILGVFDSTPNAEGQNEEDITLARSEMRQALANLKMIAADFAQSIRSHLEGKGLDPGTISVYLIGGRATGKPLKVDSDIDLIIAFEKPISIVSESDKLSASEWREIRRSLLQNEFTSICERYGVKNQESHPGRFQIMAWGDRTPADVKQGLSDGEKAILVYTEEAL